MIYQPSSQLVTASPIDSVASTATEHERNCFWAETKSVSNMPKVPLRRRSLLCSNDTLPEAPLRRRSVFYSNDTVPKAPLRRGSTNGVGVECNIAPMKVLPSDKLFHPIAAMISRANNDRRTVFNGRAQAA
jgi:hypothetical protein